ncbi:alpha/beta fold hydrolase [Aquisalimonas sp.]|uniref:alpha/beta hydrolase n=1 Tax=unclassified Aquisalimonas TaxID=2644645 RepID=UPI0025BE7C17|nr:alpha/beta fold hydrolase [Aquisalimonas sp.]
MMFGFFGFGSFAALEQPELEVVHRAPAAENRRDAPPLLFVHGAYAGAWCWDEHFLPWFAEQGFDAYAVSLRGHGTSHGRDSLDQAGVRDYVADVHNVVESMDRRPVIIGHSMGGMVVQKYLEQYEAAGAVLMASVPPGGLSSSVMRLMTSDPLLFAQISMVQGGARELVDTENAGRAIFSDDLDPVLRDGYGARMQSESQRALMDMTFMDLPRRWRMHIPPMLVLGAGRDALFSISEVKRTARNYRADLQIYPDMAHAMMLETGWSLPARAIRDWIIERGDELLTEAA